MRKILIGTVAVALSAAFLSGPPAAAVDNVNTAKLRQAVTVNGILTHERAFQRIANQNGGTRASGTPGYDASVAYVSKLLRRAGYKVRTQEFDFAFFSQLADGVSAQVSPTAKTYETNTLEYSGNGDVTGVLVPVGNNVIPATPEPSSTAGCAPSDFPAAPAGPAIALIQRGDCTFEQKVANAAAAGYEAALLFNEGNSCCPDRAGLPAVTLGTPAPIPANGLSYADGVELAEAAEDGPVTVRVAAFTESEIRPTYNVLADTPKGKQGTTVVVGAHLDSVVEGPGINDNGSGSAGILEIALQMSKQGYLKKNKLQRQVRFAFWGAEESGLLGSEHYVENLTDRQLSKIYANLNFDMIGSPNYVRFVYDGDASAFPAPEGGIPPGSAQIENVFTDYFDSQGLASAPTEFSGRSDYGPFIAVGIPAGGLFTGAEGVKTAEEAEIFGGTAGQAYDPCYHQACDNIGNLSTKALSEMADAAAHATLTLARSKAGFFEDGSRMAAKKAKTAELDFKGHHAVR
jgi:Zn-dependent M28 family amino/carboxypeptidase